MQQKHEPVQQGSKQITVEAWGETVIRGGCHLGNCPQEMVWNRALKDSHRQRRGHLGAALEEGSTSRHCPVWKSQRSLPSWTMSFWAAPASSEAMLPRLLWGRTGYFFKIQFVIEQKYYKIQHKGIIRKIKSDIQSTRPIFCCWIQQS